LLRLHRIDTAGRDPRVGRVPVEAFCNWDNRLCGRDGVAARYAAQKGADAAAARLLEDAACRFAEVVERDLGIDLRDLPGGGASGGLGAGLHALLGAALRPRFDVVLPYLGFDAHLRDADLVLTAEGRIDRHSANGKVPGEVARRARAAGVPVVALAGTVAADARTALEAGIGAYVGILRGPASLADAMRETPSLLEDAAEQVVRLVLMGRGIGG
jgi:glycerate kinase